MAIDKAILKRAAQVMFGLVLMIVVFFVSAGRLDIPRAWFLYGLTFIQLTSNIVIFYKLAPEIMRERSEIKPGVKAWDIAFSIGYFISAYAIHAVAGLDLGRFNWSYLGMEYFFLGVVFFVISAAIIAWAMIANRFFETTVTVVKGHQVISKGPYAYVRHPGYVGFILMYSSSCLILGSAVSLIPAAILAILFVGRTYMEDETLQKELDGYAEYTKKVGYRLVPGIW